MREPDFDVAAAHRWFAAHCFNAAWELIDKPNRTTEEDEQMLRLSLASAYHWTQRPDCSNETNSVGYWQTSRIYALLNQPDNARRYGNLALVSASHESVGPFYRAYAYEALARAEALAGNHDLAAQHAAEGSRFAADVADADDQKIVLADLATAPL